MKTIIDGKTLQQVAKDMVKLKGLGMQVIAEGDRVRFVASDITHDVILVMDHAAEDWMQNGSVFLPLDTLKLVSKLKGSSASIESGLITSGSRELTYMDNAYTHELPDVMDEVAVFSRTDYYKLLDARYAATKSEAQPIIQNVLLRGNGVYATDRHRLAMYQVEGNLANDDVLFPAAAMHILDGITRKGCPDHVTVSVNDRWALLKVGSVKMYVRQTDGRFPDVSKVIPSSFTSSVLFNRAELLEELTVLKSVSDWVKLSGNVIESYAKDEAAANTLKSTLDVFLKDGDTPTIGFEAQYMIDALKHSDEDTAELQFNGSVSPIVVNGTALVLPIRGVN